MGATNAFRWRELTGSCWSERSGTDPVSQIKHRKAKKYQVRTPHCCRVNLSCKESSEKESLAAESEERALLPVPWHRAGHFVRGHSIEVFHGERLTVRDKMPIRSYPSHTREKSRVLPTGTIRSIPVGRFSSMNCCKTARSSP